MFTNFVLKIIQLKELIFNYEKNMLTLLNFDLCLV